MTIAPTTPPAPTSAPPPATRPPRRAEFPELPAALRGAKGPDKARDAAQRFVAMTLVEPILKQVRQSNSAAPPWGPAPGETQFRALLDAEIARKVVCAADFPLVERLARDLRAREGEP